MDGRTKCRVYVHPSQSGPPRQNDRGLAGYTQTCTSLRAGRWGPAAGAAHSVPGEAPSGLTPRGCSVSSYGGGAGAPRKATSPITGQSPPEGLAPS